MIKKQIQNINTNWKQFIENESLKEYFNDLISFVEKEYETKVIYPTKEKIFECFKFFNVEDTKLVILGQDPYHIPNVADGLAFSTKINFKPKSLMNIFKELESDLGIKRTNCDLEDIAKQNVLLLNTCLTVQAKKAFSHKNKGWEIFTDNVIKYLNENNKDVIFLLMGEKAKDKQELIDNKENIITTSHPSPFSARHSFFGSKVFSKINKMLKDKNKEPIKWNE